MSDTSTHIQAIHDLVKDIKFAMMTTVTSEGHLHACPMTTSDFNLDNKEIWFIADASTETVSDIKANPQVNLAYVANDKDYLSINGEAQLVSDPAKLDELWHPPITPSSKTAKMMPMFSSLRSCQMVQNIG